VTIRTPSGQTKSLSLVHERTTEERVYPPFVQQQAADVRWYDSKIAYVALNSFQDPRIDTLFIGRLPELYRAKALIIDLRNNGGGSTEIGRRILEYLTNDQLLYGSKQVTRVHLPAHKAWGAFVKPSDTAGNAWATKSYLHFLDKVYHTFEYEPDSNTARGRRIVVPTALLIGHRTASAAEDFLIYADNQKHMIKIGENSFGSTGQPLMFNLPGGGSARVCTKKDTYRDGREFVGHGVKPDIEIHMTVEDLLRKRDPVLEKALDYLRSKLY
jgi:C-terminal processing protease CtpA/Prc